jgi:hypothetical protein
MPLLVQELFTLPDHMSSSSFFSGVGNSQSLTFCVKICRLLFVFFLIFWQIFFLSFIDLRLMITLLIFSNMSYYYICYIQYLISTNWWPLYSGIMWRPLVSLDVDGCRRGRDRMAVRTLFIARCTLYNIMW